MQVPFLDLRVQHDPLIAELCPEQIEFVVNTLKECLCH